jgi:diguanylate cyclase (GGDEF)-like protein
VLYLDVDRFKLINDSFGHAAGDLLLQAFARRLTASLRGTDVVARADRDAPNAAVARLGGDEFTILLSEIRAPADPARIAERVLAALDHPFDLGGQAVAIGTSIGIALFPDDGEDPETLLKNADVAMYSAKAAGRNTLQFYSKELGARSLERLTMERELRVALERDELELHYQPQLDLASGAVEGFEALLRWRHPRHGLIAAQPIVALAEETRLIGAVGLRVLQRACADAQSWLASGLGPLRVAINLSAQELLIGDFVARLAGALAASGLAPARLELEITETAVATDGLVMAARLAALRALGVELAIDDFGTGHSSLCALRRFRPRRLKIDRSFVHDLESDPDAAALVSAIIAMAQSLDLEVAAIGVETEFQASFLRQQGCRRVQGYLYSPPLPASDVAPWLLQRRRAGLAPPGASESAA